MCILGQCLYTSHFQGIYEISFSSLTRVRVICLGVSYISLSSSIVSYITAILYVDPKAPILRWKENFNEVVVFAETGRAGNMNGMAIRTEFYQPVRSRWLSL